MADPVTAEKKPAAEPQDDPRPEVLPEPWVWMRPTGPDVPQDAELARFPNDPVVIGHHEARGWELTEPPADVPFVQRPNDASAGEPWVFLVHEGIAGAARFPNDPAALQGAYDAGWAHPEPDPKDQPDEKPAKSTKRASATPADDQEG